MADIQKEQEKQEYQKYIKQVTPVHSLPRNMGKAFLVGGLICTIGQCLMNFSINMGLEKETASAWTSFLLILGSILLTGMNLYQKLAKVGGAGTLVPITGFANSVASAAIEFKKEGQVFGIGCKIFTIAGPVILYGLFSSWIMGVIYWILKVTKII